MATIVDRIMLSIGIDPSVIKKGLSESAQVAAKEHDKTQRATRQTTAEINKASESFAALTRTAMMFFGALLGARSLEQFVKSLTMADAALGRLAASLGRTPETVAAFGMAVERSGGDAKAATASFQGFAQALTELRVTGDSAILPWINRLQAAGKTQIDLTAKAETQIAQISANLAEIAKTDPAQASLLGKRIGFDPDTVTFLMRGPAAVRAMMDEARKSAPTKTDTDAARALESSIVAISQAATSLGRAIVTNLSPWIVELLKQLQDWIEKNHEWLKSEIVEGVKEFGDFLKSIPWKKIGDGLGFIVDGLKAMTEAMGGFVRASEILIGLWLGGKVLTAVNILRGAAGLPLLGALGVAGATVGGGYMAFKEATESEAEHAARVKAHPEIEQRIGPVDMAIRGARAVRRWWSGGDGAQTPPASSSPVPPPNPGAPTAGMRNNNPGNIKYTRHSATYDGVTGPSVNTDQGDPQAVFATEEQGMSALMRLAMRKYRGGRDTVNKMIAEGGGWTPGNYSAAANISRSMGVNPNDKVYFDDPDTMLKFARGLLRQEHGPASNRYSDDLIKRAIGGQPQPTTTAPKPGLGSQLFNGWKSHITNTSAAHVGGVTIVTSSKDTGGGPRDLTPILQKSARAAQSAYGLA